MTANSQTPAWVFDTAKDAIRTGEQKLIDVMLEHDEDVTDTALWLHRRSQFRSQLVSMIQESQS